METYPNLQISREIETKNHGRGSSYPSHSAALFREGCVVARNPLCSLGRSHVRKRVSCLQKDPGVEKRTSQAQDILT